jgi:hypothetical protein
VGKRLSRREFVARSAGWAAFVSTRFRQEDSVGQFEIPSVVDCEVVALS